MNIINKLTTQLLQSLKHQKFKLLGMDLWSVHFDLVKVQSQTYCYGLYLQVILDSGFPFPGVVLGIYLMLILSTQGKLDPFQQTEDRQTDTRMHAHTYIHLPPPFGGLFQGDASAIQYWIVLFLSPPPALSPFSLPHSFFLPRNSSHASGRAGQQSPVLDSADSCPVRTSSSTQRSLSRQCPKKTVL